jgi:hypothetical protein
MSGHLDEAQLEKVKHHGGKTIARCPACFEQGHDKTGKHLVINQDLSYGCVQFPGPEGKEHRKRIFALVGVRAKKPSKGTFPTLEQAIADQELQLEMKRSRHPGTNCRFLIWCNYASGQAIAFISSKAKSACASCAINSRCLL